MLSQISWRLSPGRYARSVVPRNTHGTLSFLGHVMTNDTTASNYGSRNLAAFFRDQQEAEMQ